MDRRSRPTRSFEPLFGCRGQAESVGSSPAEGVQPECGSSKPWPGGQSPVRGLGPGIRGLSAGRGLTQQQQLHLPRRLLSVFPQVLVDHLGALGRRLVLGAHGAAHPAVRRPGRRPAPHTAPGPARPRATHYAPAAGSLRVALGSAVPSFCGRRLSGLRARTAGRDGGGDGASRARDWAGEDPEAGPRETRGRGLARGRSEGAVGCRPGSGRGWRRSHAEGEPEG